MKKSKVKAERLEFKQKQVDTRALLGYAGLKKDTAPKHKGCAQRGCHPGGRVGRDGGAERCDLMQLKLEFAYNNTKVQGHSPLRAPVKQIAQNEYQKNLFPLRLVLSTTGRLALGGCPDS
eukprot:1115829-Pelagomonas_calceolata.AAC.1